MKSPLRLILTLAALALPSSLAAQASGTQELLDGWLDAMNSGGPQAVRDFYASQLDEEEPIYPLEVAEDSCGFDLVRTQAREDGGLEALVAERCFPGLQTITISPATSEQTATVTMQPYALSPAGALAYIDRAASRMAQRNAFAGTLLIAPDGEEPSISNYGFADLDRSVPITEDTPMLIASAGKMFTAVGILQLVEAGAVDLNAPLGRYLPDYPNSAMRAVTIRQLLTHRGGTGEDGILQRGDEAARERVRSIDDLIALNGERDPLFEPGTQTDYSNYGFILLGAVIEAVSGQSYYDYVAAHIFAPAGMDHAGYPLREEMAGVAEGLTTFYGQESELLPANSVLPWRGTPAGGGVASARDMLAFMDALRAGTLVAPETLALATTAGDTPWYGLGFVVNPEESWGHGGNGYGADIAVHRYLPNDTTFICMGARDMVCNRLIFAWYFRTFGRNE